MKLIGIGGRKGVGKTTLAEELINNYGFKKISFADPLKQYVCELYNWDKETVYSQSIKEALLLTPVFWNKGICEKLSHIIDETIIYNNVIKEFLTPRDALQYIGTEVLRAHRESFHCDKLSEILKSNSQHDYVIDDLRFKDELQTIQNLGGTCLFIVRPAHFNYSNHSSEVSLNWTMFDNVIINDMSKKSFVKKFNSFIKNKWVTHHRKSKSKLPKDKKDLELLLMNANWDTSVIAKQNNCSRDLVVWWADKHLINIPRNTYKLNPYVFLNVTPESAYWAGLLSADGCIKSSGGSKNRKIIELASNDKILIENFQKFLETDKPIYTKKRKNKKEGYYLSVENPFLIDSLKLWCLEPRKSRYNKIPDCIKDNEYLLKCWMVGLIDGDGSIYNGPAMNCCN